MGVPCFWLDLVLPWVGRLSSIRLPFLASAVNSTLPRGRLNPERHHGVRARRGRRPVARERPSCTSCQPGPICSRSRHPVNGPPRVDRRWGPEVALMKPHVPITAVILAPLLALGRLRHRAAAAPALLHRRGASGRARKTRASLQKVICLALGAALSGC